MRYLFYVFTSILGYDAMVCIDDSEEPATSALRVDIWFFYLIMLNSYYVSSPC